jgi:hypothetical protein
MPLVVIILIIASYPIWMMLLQLGTFLVGGIFLLIGSGYFGLGIMHWYYEPKLVLVRGADISVEEALGNVYREAEGLPPAWKSKIKAKGYEALNKRLQEETEFLRRVREYKREYARRNT